MPINTESFQTGGITQEAPSCELRWNGDVLEQKWYLVNYSSSGRAMNGETDWRPIPKYNVERQD